jgi:hypothetical protein
VVRFETEVRYARYRLKHPPRDTENSPRRFPVL